MNVTDRILQVLIEAINGRQPLSAMRLNYTTLAVCTPTRGRCSVVDLVDDYLNVCGTGNCNVFRIPLRDPDLIDRLLVAIDRVI